MGFWWEEKFDSTRFVKLFLDGIKQAAGLSKAGTTRRLLKFSTSVQRHSTPVFSG